MTPERWEQIKELFHTALAHEPASRSALLAKHCADDASLRDEIETLIASHEKANDFFEMPASDIAAALLADKLPRLSEGHAVGHFRILKPLATGGMGQVYLANDTRLSRPVALKFLPQQYTVDPDRVRRFEREARAASALNHPNIVTIHEIGHTDSLHFIATEFVDGQTLRAHIIQARMTVGEVLDVAIQIASALQTAHEAGIVHRDIKPENIMLRRDRVVKVLDFGLAKLTRPQFSSVDPQFPAGLTVQTNPGVVMGTVAYMSPEQARGLDVDARTDIWSLGVVLHEMASGRTPFNGETPSHVIVSILENQPMPLSAEAEVPAGLERIITRALCKERSERYQTAREMAQDLMNLKDEVTVESRLQEFGSIHAPNGTTADRIQYATRSTTLSSVNKTDDVAITQLSSGTDNVIHMIKRHKTGAVFASVMVLVLVGSLIYISKLNSRSPEVIDSVAVLPFVNSGGDPNTEYLSDGISDAVINALSRLPGLRVISLSTVLRYKGQQVDPQAVGRDLNVRAVLIGRMIQHGDQLTISAELVDVRDNRRLWGQQYKPKLSEILNLQQQMAREIAERLRLNLSGPDQQLLARRYTESSDAYQAYLRGRYLWQKQTGPELLKSIEYFEQAIRLDSNFAPAYAFLSDAYWTLGDKNVRPAAEVMPKARAAVARALELDDTLAEAHTALGFIGITDWEWAGAERALKRAIELNPNSAFAHSYYANYFRVMKRFDEAVAESKRAVELEPTSVFVNRNLAINLYYARRYDEVIDQCQRTLELEPNLPYMYKWLAKVYEEKGLYDKAVESYLKTAEFTGLGPEASTALRKTYATSGWNGYWRKALELKKKQARTFPYMLAENYARLGEKDLAFFWLEKAYEEHKWLITTLNADPTFDDFRSDPRYISLVRRMGLEP